MLQLYPGIGTVLCDWGTDQPPPAAGIFAEEAAFRCGIGAQLNNLNAMCAHVSRRTLELLPEQLGVLALFLRARVLHPHRLVSEVERLPEALHTKECPMLS